MSCTWLSVSDSFTTHAALVSGPEVPLYSFLGTMSLFWKIVPLHKWVFAFFLVCKSRKRFQAQRVVPANRFCTVFRKQFLIHLKYFVLFEPWMWLDSFRSRFVSLFPSLGKRGRKSSHSKRFKPVEDIFVLAATVLSFISFSNVYQRGESCSTYRY